MSDSIYQCKCGFKCVESMLSKTEGYCPVCKNGRSDMLEKHGAAKWSKKVN